ncbi:replication protein A subunit RPA32, partial [Leucogyrophana mollusca]
GAGYLTGGSPYGSASGSPGGFGRRSEISHSLRPLTVHQLNEAVQAHSDAEWVLEDAEIGQVTVVAHVVTINPQTTNNLYWLDDGTGRIEARHWTDSSLDEGAESSEGIREGTYVRVSGSLKMFGNKKYINATHLRPVKSVDEIYFHLLEAMTVTLIWTKGPPPRPGQNPQDVVARTGAAGSSAYSAHSHATASNDQYAQLSKMQRAIIYFIRDQPENKEGVHVGAIARAVREDADAGTIGDALDKLMDDGLVFTTIDDSHFKVAD